MIWQPDLLTTANMNAEELRVFDALYPAHVGRARAISKTNLSAQTELSERVMRDVIAALIVAHNIPIGSTVAPPAGYFIIATQQEAEDSYRLLRQYGLSTLRRMATIGRIVDQQARQRIQTELPFLRQLAQA